MSSDVVHEILQNEAIRAYCRTQPIRKLSLFGSFLKGTATDDSDVDLLVEFIEGAKVTYFDMYYMQEALEQIVGRDVHLVTPGGISKYFRDDVIAQAELIYEQV